MSIPNKSTIRGKVKFLDKYYDTFSIVLNDKNLKKVIFYKENMCIPYNSKPTNGNMYQWEIIDNKLYLINIDFLDYTQLEIIKYQEELKVIKKGTNDKASLIDEYKFKIGFLKRIKKLKAKIFNPMKLIFEKNRLKAKWFSGDVKLLISSKLIKTEKNKRRLYQREIFILSFKNGKLIEYKTDIEKYTQCNLKDYI